jgi:enoyl-CoA hydratase
VANDRRKAAATGQRGVRVPRKAAIAASAAAHASSRSPTNGSGAIEIMLTGGALVATLNRPALGNRISAAMASELINLAATVEDDDAILALAIAGAGRSFCTGFDDDIDSRLVETLAIVSKPTIAIINGDALDEGLELAIALDLRAAAIGARLGLTQLSRGALPHFGGTQRLPRLVGATHALKMLLTATPIGGDDAMRLGLVTYLAHDRNELDRVARELLETLASRGPLGVRMVKDAVRNGYDMTIEQGIRLEEDLYALLQTTADRAEGVRAFLEKRKPLFKGA